MCKEIIYCEHFFVSNDIVTKYGFLEVACNTAHPDGEPHYDAYNTLLSIFCSKAIRL